MTHSTHRLSVAAGLCLLALALSACGLPLSPPDTTHTGLAWEAIAPFELSDTDLDAGFVVSRDLTLQTNQRVRAAGPIFEYQSDHEGRRFHAVRPLYSHTADSESDTSLTDILWPAGIIRRSPTETSWRFLVAYGQDSEPAGGKKDRAVVFPVYFSGETEDGERYLAVFPLGGTIRDFLVQDKISFVLFPLYSRTEINDVVSKSVLWPLVTWTKGDDQEKLRVFPFYGRSEKTDEWRKYFVMWPIWTCVRHEGEDPGSGFILFPLLGHSKTPQRESWMVLPPFFRFSKNRDSVERLCPWPIIQYKRSPDLDKTFVWPLWGTQQAGTVRTRFLLWPIFWRRDVARDSESVTSLKALPFFQSQTRTTAPEDEQPPLVAERDWKLWPLMSYHRDGEASRFRMLALWPAADERAIEQNLAPLWSLFRRERSGHDFEEEFLWGLYRRAREADGARKLSVFPLYQSASEPSGDRRWSMLGGLIGLERKQLQRRLTLLYFLRLPAGRCQPKEDTPSAHDMDAPGDHP